MSYIIPRPTFYEESPKREGGFVLKDKSTLSCEVKNVEQVVISNFKSQGVEFELLDPSSENIDVVLSINEETDGFHIQVDSSGVRIRAKNPIFLLYASQVFFQIAVYHSNKFPMLTCRDEKDPFFEHRGLLFDCCRHFFSVEFVKQVLDLLCMYRFNVFHFHLTEDQAWRIEIKKYPLLTTKGTEDSSDRKYYTQEEIRDIIDYANERGIECVPEIEMPGHCSAALCAYPEYSCLGENNKLELPTERWGVFSDVYCIGNEKLYPFLSSILDEVIDLFGHQTKKIHVGADEVPAVRWKNCEKCQALMKRKNMKKARELQHYFIRWVSKYFESKDLVMIGWDEILHDDVMKYEEKDEEREGEEEDDENKEKKNVMVQVWRGHHYLEKAISLGIRCIYSPTSHCYLDYHIEKLHLKQVYTINPFYNIPKEKWSLIKGVECNVWAEKIANTEFWFQQVFPRILSISERTCNFDELEKNPYDEFLKTVRNHYVILKKLKVSYGREGLGSL